MFRTGLSKVGLPGAEQGMQEEDPTIAGLLKAQGYATGQFGKNHLGDRDEHLPTNHGFDEFFGNLYHLNAEEEPEHRDYPGDMMLPSGKTFREKFGPRGVIQSWPVRTERHLAAHRGYRPADQEAHGNRRRRDLGRRRSTSSSEKTADGTPWFVWWNGTRMHFRTHVKPEMRSAPTRSPVALWTSTPPA